MLLLIALLTTAQPSQRGPENRFEIDDTGFAATFTRADAMTLWKSPEDKKQRIDTTALVFVNKTNSPYNVYFPVDAAGPDSPLRTLLANSAPDVRLVNCPMTPGVCGEIQIAAGATRQFPAKILDLYAPSPIAQFVIRAADGAVPANDIAYVSLDPDDPARRTQDDVPSREFNGDTGAVVPLDNTGISDWDYLNPRKPPLVIRTTPTRWTVLGFENRTVDRTFVVAVPVNSETSTRGGRADAAAEGLKIEACKHVEGRQCAILTLPPGTSEAVSLDRIIDADRPVVRFQVNFFEEETAPAYATGYVRTSSAPFENPSRVGWSLFGKITGSQDPEFVKDDAGEDIRITPDLRYESRHTASMSGLARLNVKPTLGDRAEADVDLLFKQSILGGIDARIPGAKRDLDPVSVPKYRFTIFGQNGLQFSFGKFPFLETTLLAESGDGFRFNWRNFGVARILKRESSANVPERENDDHDVWIAQANNLLTSIAPLRSINLTAVGGRDDRQGNNRRYWTLGGEAFLAAPAVLGAGPLQGSVGVFYSRRTLDEPSLEVPKGDGTVAHGTVTWTHMAVNPGAKPGSKTAQRSIGFTLAGGTANRVNQAPDTTNQGYFGESGRFAPDSLFLGSFDPRFGAKPSFAPHPLAGKTYMALAYTEERLVFLQPLRWIAAALKVPDGDIVSQRATFRLQRYRFADTLFGTRDPGQELTFENFLETPRGVRVGLSLNRYVPSASFDSMFRRDPWKLTTFLQVQM
jgi:hypothetical protein